jgi:hypothetical protein
VTASVAGAGTNAVFALTNTSKVIAGTLSGSVTDSGSQVSLTSEGTLDWVHWGDAPSNRKNGVSAQISDWQIVGSGGTSTFSNDPRPIVWSDGTPWATSFNLNGVYAPGMGAGFSFTVPADTTARTLVVHAGGWFSGGTLTAHLSDGSASDFKDVQAAVSGQYDRNYTLNYQAGSAGQSITIKWVMTSGNFNGNVTLSAAALSGSGGQPVAGSLAGNANSSISAVNLTAEGTADWVHWGDNSLNRKATGNAQIGSYSVIGSNVAIPYPNDSRPMSWTDGSPVTASSNNAYGFYIDAIGNGFTFTAPAGTGVHTLTVHVGGWNSGGTMTAHLSDGSASDFTDSTNATSGQYDRNYTFTYNSVAAGQTLRISWVNNTATGNVTLNGAALK